MMSEEDKKKMISIKDKFVGHIKIFQGSPVRELIRRCLTEGYFPANIDLVSELVNYSIVSDEVKYTTSTIEGRNEYGSRDATFYDLIDISNGLNNRRLFYYGLHERPVAYYNELDKYGVLIGIPFNENQNKVLIAYNGFFQIPIERLN